MKINSLSDGLYRLGSLKKNGFQEKFLNDKSPHELPFFFFLVVIIFGKDLSVLQAGEAFV